MAKEKKRDKVKNKPTDKKVLSFFILAFPTMLIVLISMLSRGIWWAVLVQSLLAFFQFVMMKQFLDTYYELI